MAAALREISPARIFARPTAEDLWLGPARASVLSQLSEAAPNRAVVGPRSSGRTTLLRHLAHRNSKLGPTLRLTDPTSKADEVLRALLRSAGLGTGQHSPVALRHLLDVYLTGQRKLGSHVHLEIDDADRLGAGAWQEIARIVAGHGNGPAPMLLLGLSSLDESRAPAAAYLKRQDQRAVGRLSWLDADEVAAYLEWRFSRFGLSGINTPTATRLLARCSRGCFAALDQLSQIALLLLRQGNGTQLNITVVREAADQIRKRRQLKRQREHEPEHGQVGSAVSNRLPNAALR